jgi:hypothetical protein
LRAPGGFTFKKDFQLVEGGNQLEILFILYHF